MITYNCSCFLLRRFPFFSFFLCFVVIALRCYLVLCAFGRSIVRVRVWFPCRQPAAAATFIQSFTLCVFVCSIMRLNICVARGFLRLPKSDLLAAFVELNRFLLLYSSSSILRSCALWINLLSFFLLSRFPYSSSVAHQSLARGFYCIAGVILSISDIIDSISFVNSQRNGVGWAGPLFNFLVADTIDPGFRAN